MVLSDPTQCCDNRRCKQQPDFKHKESEFVLGLNNGHRPPWVDLHKWEAGLPGQGQGPFVRSWLAVDSGASRIRMTCLTGVGSFKSDMPVVTRYWQMSVVPITKQVLADGKSWKTPRAPYEVKVWITSRELGKEPFLNCTEGEPFHFTFGKAKVPARLERALER